MTYKVHEMIEDVGLRASTDKRVLTHDWDDHLIWRLQTHHRKIVPGTIDSPNLSPTKKKLVKMDTVKKGHIKVGINIVCGIIKHGTEDKIE